MRFNKTVDVDFDLDAEDVLDWLESAHPAERDRVLRVVIERYSPIARHCRLESSVQDRPVAPVTLFMRPDNITVDAIISTCGRFAAHPGEPDAWRTGMLDWSAQWRVTHVRTGLEVSHRASVDATLRDLDALAALEFEDFGEFGNAGKIPDNVGAAIKAIVNRVAA